MLNFGLKLGGSGQHKPFRPFTPADLFLQGEQGAWYLIRPELLFQDSAGTVLVTADGDPFGLILDQSQGLALGPEQATNGGFDTDLTGWSQNNPGYWVQEDGRAFHAESSNYNSLSQYYTGLTGSYEVTFTLEVTSGRMLYFYESNPSTTVNGSNFGVGTYNIKFIANAGLGKLGFARLGGATGAGYVDNVSVKELPGNHAAQATSSKRPSAINVPPWKAAFDGVDDELVVTFASSLGSDCTIARAVPGTGASILTGQTIGINYTINSDFNALVIVDRALTSAETTQLTAYLNQTSGV